MLRNSLLALLLLAAPAAMAAEAMKMKPAAQAGAAAAPSDQAYLAAMDKMMSEMTAKPTGNADRDFVTMMLPHHQGAVDMAKVELQYGNDALLLKLARAIVDSQAKEIALMSEWKAKHGK